MSSIHANSAREAVTKLCTLPLLAGENISGLSAFERRAERLGRAEQSGDPQRALSATCQSTSGGTRSM
jgi:hypothetical protein